MLVDWHFESPVPTANQVQISILARCFIHAWFQGEENNYYLETSCNYLFPTSFYALAKLFLCEFLMAHASGGYCRYCDRARAYHVRQFGNANLSISFAHWRETVEWTLLNCICLCPLLFFCVCLHGFIYSFRPGTEQGRVCFEESFK